MCGKELKDYIVPNDNGISILDKKFTCVDYSIFPIESIREPNIVDIAKVMESTLDHGDSKKTIYVGFLKQENKTVDMFILHTNFEDSSTWATSALTRIMLELEFITDSTAHIELWDNYWEKFLIHIYDVPYDFTKKLKGLKNKNISHYKDKKYEKWVNGK